MADQKRYKIEQVVKIFSDAGPNPTTKAGREMAKSKEGATFLTTKEENGWLAMDDDTNRWIQKSACKEIDVVVPPPVGPQLIVFQWREQLMDAATGKPRIDSNGVPVMGDWIEGFYYV